MGTRNFALIVLLSGVLFFPARVLNAAALEEVVVTAQKREQSLQDIPISVSAVTARDMEANIVEDIFDLRSVVPALQVNSVDPPSQGTAFALRGLGNSVFNMGFEPAVGTFVDGIYRSRSGLIATSDFVDLERVEVLKGPQGTLFGRNTSAGVVHFISKRPSFEEVEGMAQATWEEHDRWRLKGSVNVPVDERLALRFSGAFADGDGFIDNAGQGPSEVHDLDRWNIKGQLLWEPTDDLSIWFSADYSELDELCCVPSKFVNDPRVSVVNLPTAQAIGSTVIDPANFKDLTIASNLPPQYKAKDAGFALEINWQIGDVTLTSLTGYRSFEDDTTKDNDFTGVDVLRSFQALPEVDLITEEFRIAGSFDEISLEWIVGFFYSKEDIKLINEFIWGPQTALFPFGPLFGITPGRAFLADFDQEIESIAGFGHFTLNVTDKLVITGGARWTRDEKKGTLVNDHPATNAYGLPSNSLPLAVVFDYDQKITFSEPTGTASIQYHWTDDMMTFFTYSRGYKSGGLSMTRDAAGSAIFFGAPGVGCPPGSTPIGGPLCGGAQGDASFAPEFADHFEIGFKGTFLDNRLRLNAAGWITKFEGLQVQVLRPEDGSFAVSNVKGATSQGIELESVFVVNDFLDLNFSLQWLDATHDNGVGQIETGPGTVPRDGQNLSQSSEWTGVVGGNFEHALTSNWNLFMNANVFFRSKVMLNPGGPIGNHTQDGYSLLNMRGGIRSSDDKYELSVWCRNCTDKIYYWSNFAIPFDGLLLGHGSRWSHTADPRFIGVSATYRF